MFSTTTWITNVLKIRCLTLFEKKCWQRRVDRSLLGNQTPEFQVIQVIPDQERNNYDQPSPEFQLIPNFALLSKRKHPSPERNQEKPSVSKSDISSVTNSFKENLHNFLSNMAPIPYENVEKAIEWLQEVSFSLLCPTIVVSR
eukprot:TRINITY_DN12781_c0_g1_i1.p1 TRINITY_DN12781_c0_g1~~TRINITY_DN12781_c0_g1_i1.p1  ORF type:complete len:143 (-),score=12.34 TRINITY_DN12781_c0_g1_i1:181-609(-)